jgi:hypothetical protein
MEQHRAPSPRIPPHILALLAFAPVPLRARRDGWTVARQRRYVLALAVTGHGGRAAALVGMTAQSACALRRRPGAESFTRACETAWRLAAQRRRALAAAARRCGPDVFPPREPEPFAPYETSACPERRRRARPAPAEGRDAGTRSQ